MMASQFSTYTTEELQKKLKTQNKVSLIHGFIVLLLFIVAGLNTYENGFSFSSFLPLFFLPMQVFIMFEVKKIKKELKLKS